MPHLTLEYSANLEARLDIQNLCNALCDVAVATGVFPLGGIRVRALRCDLYAIADKHQQNGFIDLSIRIGEGRDMATKQKAGNAIFDHLTAMLADEFDNPHFALSMQIRELDKDLSWKKNSIHARLK